MQVQDKMGMRLLIRRLNVEFKAAWGSINETAIPFKNKQVIAGE